MTADHSDDPSLVEARYASYPSLHGRSVFITGGATGLGQEMVCQFAAQGSAVYFVDIAVEAGVALATRLAGTVRHDPVFAHCDVTDAPALQAAIVEAGRLSGPISVLINNAANDVRHRVEDVTEASWDGLMALNLRPHFFAAQAVSKMMRAQGGGSIINLGSIIWQAKFPEITAYSTAKAAIEGLTRSLARDLGGHGIRVNCIVPGWIMTQRQLQDWVTPQAEAEIQRAQCLPTRLQPADVARMALWLAADDSAQCTAQRWVVDAGWS